jgi:hypothetical protein
LSQTLEVVGLVPICLFQLSKLLVEILEELVEPAGLAKCFSGLFQALYKLFYHPGLVVTLLFDELPLFLQTSDIDIVAFFFELLFDCCECFVSQRVEGMLIEMEFLLKLLLKRFLS